MTDITHSAEDCSCKRQLAELEEEHNRMSQNLHMSALYGSSLLEENKALKLQIKEIQSSQEIMIQELHNLKMQLEISQKSNISQQQEIELLKEVVAKSDDSNKVLKQQEEDKHRKETQQLSSDITNLRDQILLQKEEYEGKIAELELQLNQLKNIERPSVSFSCDHDEEITYLQAQVESHKETNRILEEKLYTTEKQLLQLQTSEARLRELQSECEYELQKKERELLASEKLVEEKRIEVLELQSLLEAEKVSQTNPEKRGNSIFSEVDDRRQQVERRMAKLEALLEAEKKKNTDLLAELLKVKNQLAYAAYGGTGPDQSKHVEHLESLLRRANIQNQDLLKRLEDAEKACSAVEVPLPELEDTRQWMKAMLLHEKEENAKLRAEIRGHIRSNLCQNEQMIQVSRRLNESEKNLQRARAEVARLKIKMDELAVNENAMVTSPHTNHRVVENLKSMLEKNETETLKSDQPLKERIVRQVPANSIDLLVAKSSVSSDNSISGTSFHGDHSIQVGGNGSDEKTNANGGAIKQVRMNTDVRVVYDDGDSTLETLCLEDKFTAGAKKTQKPQGKQVEVIDATKASNPVMECNQQ